MKIIEQAVKMIGDRLVKVGKEGTCKSSCIWLYELKAPAELQENLRKKNEGEDAC